MLKLLVAVLQQKDKKELREAFMLAQDVSRSL